MAKTSRRGKMVKLTDEQIIKIKAALAKMSIPKDSVKPALEPIYDDIYFKGLAYLNEQDKGSNHE